MAVIPGDSHPAAESSLSVAQINALSEVTETSMLRVKTNSLLPDFGKAGQFLFKAIGDLAGGILGVVGGIAGALLPDWLTGAVRQQAQAVRDGQRDLNERTDMLSPLLDYGGVSTPPGTGDIMNGTGRIPFTYQIGAIKGVRLRDGVIVLEDKGVWDMRCQVTTSWTANPLAQDLKVWLRVLRPDDSIFSQQAFYCSTLKSQTIPVVTCVQVPEAGYKVDCLVWAQDGNRGWWRGPEWTRLIVQHISRETGTGGTGGEGSDPGSDNPDLPEDPPDTPDPEALIFDDQEDDDA